MSDFLLEIGTEEIPARMIASATAELQRRITELVTRERLAPAAGSEALPESSAEAFASPRRLAVLIRGLADSQPDVAEQLLGPATTHAYKDGAPTQAAVAFAKKAGVPLTELTRATTPKGEYLAANVIKKGKPAIELLTELVPKEIAAVYWAKNMYWRPGKPERFVRPVRWLVALLDDQIVPIEFGGITASRTSRGHRILAPAAGSAALPAPAPAAGSAALPALAPAAGSAALPALAPAAGSAALPAPAPAAGSAALPALAPAAGSAALPALAPAAGSAALPALAPAAGSAALPAPAPAAGSAALPGSSDVTLASPAEYAAKLRAANVLPSYAEREHTIRKALDKAVRAIPGARWREDKELLDTVVNLTEAPSVILGNFDDEFLALPEEVLVTVMRDHQKYFAVEDAAGKLAPHFLAVLNTVTDAEGEAIVRHGNERVLRARFNDARFFWNTDQKLTLKDRIAMLKSVTFQKELGSYYDKAIRTQHLGSLISAAVSEHYSAHRPGVVYKAALMAKCDLTTELVKEFTELQGIIGGLYLVHQAERMELPEGSAIAIGQAIYDQYKPTSMEDDVPRSLEGAVLAIADKADTIAGMFALGMIPSGSKDPFALRRAANGIVRTLIEHNLPLSLSQLMQDALRQYHGTEAESKFSAPAPAAGSAALPSAVAQYEQNVAAFFRERLEFYLRDARGFAYDVTNAVLASGADNAVDALARAQALAKVRGSDDFDAISSSFKRIKNILRQAAEKGITIPERPDATLNGSLFGSSAPMAEKSLYTFGLDSAARYQGYLEDRHYDSALSCVAGLRPFLDRFFDDVMVMVDDPDIRANRLSLLKALYDEFSKFADFSEVVTGGKSS